MKLMVIRHAMSEANEKGMINSRSNEDNLSARGRAQLPQLVTEFNELKLDAIYSSPLQRALDTAQPIADNHSLEVTIDKRLIEIGAGTFTNTPINSTKDVFSMEMPDLLNTYNYDFTEYGGESSTDVRYRVDNFINDLKSTEHNVVLIVTHGGILRWFHYVLSGRKVKGQDLVAGTHTFEL